MMSMYINSINDRHNDAFLPIPNAYDIIGGCYVSAGASSLGLVLVCGD